MYIDLSSNQNVVIKLSLSPYNQGKGGGTYFHGGGGGGGKTKKGHYNVKKLNLGTYILRKMSFSSTKKVHVLL